MTSNQQCEPFLSSAAPSVAMLSMTGIVIRARKRRGRLLQRARIEAGNEGGRGGHALPLSSG